MSRALRIHPADDVAVALTPLPRGEAVEIDAELRVIPLEEIPAGHKLALRELAPGEPVRKYGLPIGNAKTAIAAGEWVHSHNLGTGLEAGGRYEYAPQPVELPAEEPLAFRGYHRADGRAGIRNELWIIPTVGCVNDLCKLLARRGEALAAKHGLDGVWAFPHPYGCSQLGDDHDATARLLAALVRHPNAGGVLVVGLGCENNTMERFRDLIPAVYLPRTRFLVCQEVEDELGDGTRLLEELAALAGEDRREPMGLDRLVVGLKCGGSDGLSGITANPVAGAFSDRLTAMGGSAVLTEVPEMFGAETLLLRRCGERALFERAVEMIDGFKRYFTDHGQPVYENPSPGNRAGGITTLEEKSLGCVQKGGLSPVRGVLDYGETVTEPGLNLLRGPGNDLVSATTLTAAGANLILFTTGRGTPFGAPAPTLKLSSNSGLAARKPHWIDFDAGPVAEGESIGHCAGRLLELVRAVASGERRTRTEELGCREIAIWKSGVTL